MYLSIYHKFIFDGRRADREGHEHPGQGRAQHGVRVLRE